ncbi:MAG: hypothetical protein ACOYYU_00330 [Chloroflexota bacterium]
MEISTQITDWLMEGDPAIRWQVLRDLLDAPPEEYEKERGRVAFEGWGADLLSRQDADGKWAGGLYSPKWTSTTYTLLTLRHFGLAHEHPAAQKACAYFLAKGLYHDGGINLFKSLDYSETCVNGMLLALLSYFRSPDERVHNLVGFLLGEQMEDGGWNCERINGATHASFHTTISVLEGLREYASYHPAPATVIDAARRAHEFLLLHRLYKSHRTGKVVDPAMTRMNFPPRWRYDFIRALDYFQAMRAPRDERMDDAIALLRAKRLADGRWPAYRPWAGRMYFEMEKGGQPGRWNTLRALRVLRWWDEQ